MRRADRLFQILNLLRNRRTVITAQQLAGCLEVSERTIYRDIQALSLSGVPVEGEAGVGYRLQRHFDLPPLMFEGHEVESLLLGARMVQAWSDRQLAAAATSAMHKILAVVPDHLRHSDDELPLVVPDFHIDPEHLAFSEEIRAAIRQRQVLSIGYQRIDGEQSQRAIEPLGLFFWGLTWTVLAWCQLRQGYRTFRLDRILSLIDTGQHFTLNDHKSLNHYLNLMKDCNDE
ncbi:YafY family transcriptional regulator [Exilibacterium tricleocarpae]|uniref:YafY family transcriptional regulator n=1 Tax=Exilibacterium tricleocarpae TaxID=2591008 RepID=A0A545T665_9GAMM|nr:YafY family protein [Exilibacterium tricleocarpae]TQV72678.1 YafY family transcriptional regulator [Exilibacterium tricleocarpae]